MQPLGVLFCSAGLWLVYCGVTAVPPLETMGAIISNPSQATEIIQKARAENQLEISKRISVGESVTGGLAAAFSGKDPFAGWNKSDDWAAHKNRGSEGGQDFPVPVGTPIPSPFAGTLTFVPNAGAAGNKSIVTLANGWKFEALHLSRFQTSLGNTKIKPGTIIGYTGGRKGDPGAGSSTGPHLHVHMRSPGGVVSNYYDYIKAAK